jgi:hypothetical protein
LLSGPEVSNITTVVGGICPGVKSSKEGKLFGVAEMKLAHVALPAFEVSVSRQRYAPLMTTGTLKIKNRTGAQQVVQTIREREIPAGNWLKPTRAEREACLGKYAAGESCSMAIEFSNLQAGWLEELVYAESGSVVGHVMLAS